MRGRAAACCRLVPVDQPASALQSQDLVEEIRQRIRSLERSGPWEMGLGAAVAAALLGMLYCAVAEHRFHFRMETSGSIFFAALLLLLLLAWLARDRARRAHITEFQVLAEVIQRQRLSKQAWQDPLTNVYNRSGLEEVCPSYILRAERSQTSLALVVLDLDDFHELNNRFGHLAGDSALAEFANCIRDSIRGSDLIARYGGDEFVVLLEETLPVGTEIVVGRINERLAARNANLRDGMPLSFTFGIALFRKGMNFAALFNEADQDLLRRKAQRASATASPR